MSRIAKLEIQGFRAFGSKHQTLVFPSPIAAVWGANSQGKTSLAEAVEFLLTGQIARRTLMASGQDEFADALRNAHMVDGLPTYIEAEFLTPGGTTHKVRRTLKTDYGKKQDCESILEIDGKKEPESALQTIGIILSQPPLRAPVLAQHTLGYLFSARPQERASYFKALLEVGDLEVFRNEVASLQDGLDAGGNVLIEKLDKAASLDAITRHLKPLLTKVPTLAALRDALSESSAELVRSAGGAPPVDYDERIAALEALLVDKRAQAFPMKAFESKALASWSTPSDEQFGKLDRYVAERAKIDEETRRLTSLFREALAIPGVKQASDPVDCPLCASENSLTPERIAFIAQKLADTDDFRKAENSARSMLAQLENALGIFAASLSAALPLFLTNPARSRRARGFRVERIRTLLGAEHEDSIQSWLQAARDLARAYAKAARAISRLKARVEEDAANLEQFSDVADLKAGIVAAAEAAELVARELAAYSSKQEAIVTPLTAQVDAASQTAGWQDLIDVAGDIDGLRNALIERGAFAALQKELAQAIKQIDKGNEAVLDDKFSELSNSVQVWWDLLRPDELSFFSAVGPRPGARRTIDFKAGLAVNADRSDMKLRDVIAVFSQSQLHCLGLSVFLARALHEGTRFIVLDDPILSSDEDYRAYFNAAVLEKLCALGVQVIVLTQCQRTWKDLGQRYLHENIALFQIVLQVPSDGSVVTNTADDLTTMLIRADILSRGGHPELHKQAGSVIRDAAERFCKEVLVADKRAKGDKNASIGDHDGKTLGHMSPLVEPLLNKDPSHPGKLRTIGGAVNPAKHDDAVPAGGVLRVAIGDLQFLKKTYL